ncbi:MAG: hypothetical protein CL836_02565 [Crocinitomicaceae bacterium]|nr:hypothetical protein [Crocinitomicaceae bacterium]|tara:strand:- start:453 stop:638 length:186 start_codon:yes stop_codon:yes gene_type:complete
MKRLKKPFLYASLAFIVGTIFTYLNEPKTVDFKDAIIGGVKIGIIAFTSVIVIDNLGFKLD